MITLPPKGTTKARSPSYPSMGLKEAIEKIEMVYKRDYQNKIPKSVVAAHIGYKGISGASLPVLAALSQYGLLDGRGDSTSVSNLALAIIAHPTGSTERYEAIKVAAQNPELFNEIAKKFPHGNPSDAAIRSHLLTEKFIPSAADTAIRSYRETKDLLIVEEESYKRKHLEEATLVEPDHQTDELHENGASPSSSLKGPSKTQQASTEPSAGTRREVITLDEGDVVITFPESLSVESVNDLKDHLELFIKKIERRFGGGNTNRQ